MGMPTVAVGRLRHIGTGSVLREGAVWRTTILTPCAGSTIGAIPGTPALGLVPSQTLKMGLGLVLIRSVWSLFRHLPQQARADRHRLYPDRRQLRQHPAAIRSMAEALGVPDRGEAPAAHAEAALARVDAVLAEVPEEAHPRVCLVPGPEGLEAPARGSVNAGIMERVGAINVVVSETRGLVTPSLERVIAWAPATMIAIDRDFAAGVQGQADRLAVPAVAGGRVFLAPSAPFGCGTKRPPCELYVEPNGIEHRRTRARSPGNDGFVERFSGTVPDEFFRVKMRESVNDSMEALQADPDAPLVHWNSLAPHLGYRNMGRRPSETVMSFVRQEGQVDSRVRMDLAAPRGRGRPADHRARPRVGRDTAGPDVGMATLVRS